VNGQYFFHCRWLLVVGEQRTEDRSQPGERCFGASGDGWGLMVDACVFQNILSSTLYGVTNPVTEVTKAVTHEESLTNERWHAETRSSRRRKGLEFRSPSSAQLAGLAVGEC